MPLWTPIFTELPYDVPLSDHHIAWLATRTESYETHTWPEIAFFLPDFSSMTLPFLPLYPKSLQVQIGSVSLLWAASFQVYLSWQHFQVHNILKTLSCPQLHLYHSKAHNLCPAVLQSHQSDGMNKWGSRRCPRYGGGGFCPEAAPGINSQSVGTTSDPQYGGFVDADVRK